MIVMLVIQALGENLKVRQQVIATATVYFKRFYSRFESRSFHEELSWIKSSNAY